jgi:hypothetical protein
MGTGGNATGGGGTASSTSGGGAGTAGGGTGGAVEAGADARDAIVDTPILDPATDAGGAPATLSATGFFKSIGADGGLVLGDGVRPYEPRYKLWSDGADKQRWVYLPPNTKINNSDQDHWVLPVGAKFWKEFALNGKRIETRLIWHVGPGPDDYLYATYHWKPTDAGAQPSDAVLVPPDRNVINANGTKHDIPFEEHCHRCHDPLKEHVLGFSAFQLTPASANDAGISGVTIKTLSDEGSLMVPAPNGFQIPGATAVVRDALGYLHANCGNCHNDTPGVAIPAPKMIFKVLVAQTDALQTGAYTTALNVLATKPDHMPDPLLYRIFGGSTAKSSASYRMALRSGIDGVAQQDQMPPVASDDPDTAGIAIVNAWIATLPAPPDQ